MAAFVVVTAAAAAAWHILVFETPNNQLINHFFPILSSYRSCDDYSSDPMREINQTII